ncbi:hypothetical protein L596_001867 [Steinernema carpocapsae]|uniref:Uncharacterized protein n=1 Tax=Steinernema carpocapsae TaxID=34508 RepID=A0A4U8UMG9_STECR|nr:hypothetical protein L596_001867 [Steinernema carpocapsae]
MTPSDKLKLSIPSQRAQSLIINPINLQRIPFGKNAIAHYPFKSRIFPHNCDFLSDFGEMRIRRPGQVDRRRALSRLSVWAYKNVKIIRSSPKGH